MTKRLSLQERLTQLEKEQSLLAPPVDSPMALTTVEDARPLAHQLDQTFRSAVQRYQQVYGLSEPEAIARLTEPIPGDEERTLNGPADDIDWLSLN